MNLSAYLAFVLASTLLIVLPGPNVALIVGNSLAGGRKLGLATVLGTSLATVVQITAVVVGLSVLLGAAASVFGTLRWLGVAYLLFLGVKAWRSQPPAAGTAPAAPSRNRAVATGFAVSLTNPKTLLFHGAFLPQFVDPAGDPRAQFVLLGATFVALAALLDCGWAVLADRARALVALRPRLRERIAGTTLIAAACGLALARERA